MSEMEFRYRVVYARQKQGRFLAHLDAMNHLLRAVRRSGLPYVVTQGCHPRPKASFGPPVPLGFASRCETMDIYLREEKSLEEFQGRLVPQMPLGLDFCQVTALPLKASAVPAEVEMTYRLVWAKGHAEAVQWAFAFFRNPEGRVRVGKAGQEKEVPIGVVLKNARLEENNDGSELWLEFFRPPPGSASGAKIIQAGLQAMARPEERPLIVERVSISWDEKSK